MTFSNGLRALLRQDPNIIMVGEIRDGETADLGVQAALTGHLVFSTLHTNNAATCLPRLLNMGVEPFLIASTLRIVIAQRLVRRLCVDCREAFTPDGAILAQIKKIFKLDDSTELKKLHARESAARDDGIGKSSAAGKDLSTDNHGIKRLFKAHDNGCDSCNHTGYKGRIGIYEVLKNDESVQRLIVSSASSESIEQQAVKDGMVKMQLDGLIKALRGETTIGEVLRVTAQE